MIAKVAGALLFLFLLGLYGGIVAVLLFFAVEAWLWRQVVR